MDDIWMLVNIQENKQYLEEHQLMVYFEDVIVQTLALRNEFNKIKTLKFFREYFYSVYHGGHVILRDYEFLNISAYNKLSVSRMLMQVYQPLVTNAGKLSAKSYHSLLQLLWPDFPFEEVQEAFMILSDGYHEFPSLLSFLDFITGFHKNFCLGCKFSVEVSIMNQQLLDHIEQCRNKCVENQATAEWNEKNTASMLQSVKESVQEKLKSRPIASSWSLSHNLSQNTDLKNVALIKESSSFSNSDSSTVKKLLRSSSSTKESHSLDLGSSESVKQFQASVKSRLSPRRLSGSLNLLQPTDREKPDESNPATVQKLRSKSALNIQKSSTLPHK